MLSFIVPAHNEELWIGRCLDSIHTSMMEQIGDQIERVVTWKGGPDVSELAGRPLRLRFVMHDADLYSLRFR